jgi:hypothetical protein
MVTQLYSWLENVNYQLLSGISVLDLNNIKTGKSGSISMEN